MRAIYKGDAPKRTYSEVVEEIRELLQEANENDLKLSFVELTEPEWEAVVKKPWAASTEDSIDVWLAEGKVRCYIAQTARFITQSALHC